MNSNESKSDYKRVALNFLLYSYFGIDIDTFNEKNSDIEIKYAAINKAYGDAARHVLHLPEENDYEELRIDGTLWLMENIEDNKGATLVIDNFCKSELIRRINNSCEEANKKLESGKKKYGISKGHIQKWVNMSYKYLCIIYTTKKEMNKAADNPYEEFVDSDRYHIPIDRYILKEAELDKDYSWSKIEEYTAMEAAVKDSESYRNNGCKNYEWENESWIKQSKEERNKNDKIRKAVLSKCK